MELPVEFSGRAANSELCDRSSGSVAKLCRGRLCSPATRGACMESILLEFFRQFGSGLGAAALYAALVFGFFVWVDKDISPDVKQTISRWIDRRYLDRNAVAKSIVAIFDRIYGSQLISLSALLRSSLISLILTSAFVVLNYKALEGESTDSFVPELVTFSVYSNVVSDYLSLFFVKRMLVSIPSRPLLTLLLGAFVGSLVIYLFFVTRLVVPAFHYGLLEPEQQSSLVYAMLSFSVGCLIAKGCVAMAYVSLVPPALFVHLWLVLMAIALVTMRLATYFMRSIELAERLLKKEESQPLRAIAYVAACYVFFFTAATSVLMHAL
jgi:hypothetical protein